MLLLECGGNCKRRANMIYKNILTAGVDIYLIMVYI